MKAHFKYKVKLDSNFMMKSELDLCTVYCLLTGSKMTFSMYLFGGE